LLFNDLPTPDEQGIDEGTGKPRGHHLKVAAGAWGGLTSDIPDPGFDVDVSAAHP
jgi:hypothetical protein